MFVPSKAFRIFLGDSCLILLKNRNFCAHENNSNFLPERDKIPILLQKINIQIAQVVLIFQNFWSSRSFRNSQIATDCSVLTDSVSLRCVLILMALWFSLMSFCHRKVGIQ